MAIPALSTAPRRTTHAKLALARRVAHKHTSLESLGNAVGLNPSTLSKYGIKVRSGTRPVSDTITEPVFAPEPTTPDVATLPDPDGPASPQPRTVEESRRLAKTRIGGAGYFKTYNGDSATLNRRELRRLIKQRLTVEAKRVASYPQQTYDPKLDQTQRDMTDCLTAAAISSNSKRSYNARHIEQVANEFRRTKLGVNAPRVTEAAVLETVFREQSKRA